MRELSYYVSKNPVDDQSNHHYPLAALYALTFNINRDPAKAAEMSVRDALLFKEKEDEDDVEIGEAMGW